jgi:hypothetical protein
MRLPNNAITLQQQGAEVRIIVRTFSEADATAFRESIVADLTSSGRLSLALSMDNPRVETING